MFLFRLTGVKGKSVRVDLKGVALRKWLTLNPVYRYERDAARIPKWREAPPLTGTGTPSHNGPILPDTSEESWHFVSDVWAERNTTLSFIQHFDDDRVQVAMKVPFTPSDGDALAEELKPQAGVQVIEVGRSNEGRALRVIKVSSGEDAERTRPCIVLYAREHSDEQDSSWAAVGALRMLASESEEAAELRRNFTFLVIPILDPDGAAHNTHETMTFSFQWNNFTADSLCYGRFFKNWISSGKRLDVVFNLHNVESAENRHLSTAALPPAGPLGKAAFTLYESLRKEAIENGYAAQAATAGTGVYSDRLGGWLSDTYHPAHLLIEFNSQDPERHLSSAETQFLGSRVVTVASRFLADRDGLDFLAQTDAFRAEYAKRWSEHATAITTDNPFAAERACLVLSQANGAGGP